MEQAVNKSISSIMKTKEIFIKSEGLTETMSYEQMDDYQKEWNINGEKVVLGVKKLNK